MKLKYICADLGIPYDSKHPTRSLDRLRKEYVIEQYENKKDYIVVRPLTENEKIEQTKLVPYRKQFCVEDKDKNSGGVYKIELKETNQIYIGQTKNFYKRFCRHCNPSCFSSARQIIEKGALFNILEIEPNERLRFAIETQWCDYYKQQGYELLNDENVLYRHRNKKTNKDLFIEIMQEHDIDNDTINNILSEYYSRRKSLND